MEGREGQSQGKLETKKKVQTAEKKSPTKPKSKEVKGKEYHAKTDAQLLEEVRDKLQRERESQHLDTPSTNAAETKPKRKSRAKDRSDIARQILEKNTQFTTELTDDERAELVKRLQKALKYREQSMIGIVGNLARKGILQATHVTSEGKINVDQLDEATREKYKFLSEYQLSTRSKLRQEASTRTQEQVVTPVVPDSDPFSALAALDKLTTDYLAGKAPQEDKPSQTEITSEAVPTQIQQSEASIPAPFEQSPVQQTMPLEQVIVTGRSKDRFLSSIRSRVAEFFSRFKRSERIPERKLPPIAREALTRRDFVRKVAAAAVLAGGAVALEPYLKVLGNNATTEGITAEVFPVVKPQEPVKLKRQEIDSVLSSEPLADNPPVLASGDIPPSTDEFKPQVFQEPQVIAEALPAPEALKVEKPNFSLLSNGEFFPITQGFGQTYFCTVERPNIYGPNGHSGFVFRTPSGTVLTSPVEGRIVQASSDFGNYGGAVTIETNDGHFLRFGHLKQIDVEVGSTINALTPIGLSGGGDKDRGKGKSTGAHLHYEVFTKNESGKEIYIDPSEYHTMDGVEIAAEAAKDFPAKT